MRSSPRPNRYPGLPGPPGRKYMREELRRLPRAECAGTPAVHALASSTVSAPTRPTTVVPKRAHPARRRVTALASSRAQAPTRIATRQIETTAARPISRTTTRHFTATHATTRVPGRRNDVACVSGACKSVCSGSFTDCENGTVDGCETDTNASNAHCGACANPCSPPNAIPHCTSGVCQIGSCLSGWVDCDGEASNGCETPDQSTTCIKCGLSTCCGNACIAPFCDVDTHGKRFAGRDHASTDTACPEH